jgi:hypothetical protein
MSLDYIFVLLNGCSAYPIRRDIVTLDMDAKNPSNDNIRISNPVWASCFLAVIFIRNTDDAVYAALERHGRGCDTRWAHEFRGHVLNIKFFEFVLPRLFASIVNLVSELVAGELS